MILGTVVLLIFYSDFSKIAVWVFRRLRLNGGLSPSKSNQQGNLSRTSIIGLVANKGI